MPALPHSLPQRQGGSALLLVLIILSVMLLGGLAFARMSTTGILIAGNAAQKDGAAHASEVGINNAFFAIEALANDSADVGGWYLARARALTAQGMPAGVDWNTAASVDVNGYTVRYVAERMCATTPVVDARRQCLVREQDELASAKPPDPAPPPPRFAKQYRITVRVEGSRGTTSFAQVLMTRSLN